MAELKSDRMLRSIREALAASMETAANEMLAAASARAPTPEEEYRELNAEAGSMPLTPLAGDRSADVDGRIRFQKSLDTYIKSAILKPNNKLIGESTIAIGNLPFLKEQTSFKYTNLGAHGETHTHKVTGYFMAFEGGTAGAAVGSEGITTFTVQPHTTTSKGKFYPLRPGADQSGTRRTMIKSIQGRWMFMPSVLAAAAKAVFNRALAELGPGRESS